MRCTAHQKYATGRTLFNELLYQGILPNRFASIRPVARQVMAFVHDQYVPTRGLDNTLRVRLVSGFVDASYDSLIFQICVGVVARSPFPETQAETGELDVHIADKASRSKVKDSQTRLLFE